MKLRAEGPWPAATMTAESGPMSVDARPVSDVADLGYPVDALFSMVLDRTSDGVILATADGVIVFANQPLLDLFGYEADELTGKRVETLIPEDYRRTHRNHVHK